MYYSNGDVYLLYLVLLGKALMLEAPLRVIRYVKGVVSRRLVRVKPALYHKSIRFSTDNMDLGDQQTVDIPSDSPTHSTWKKITLSKSIKAL